MSTHNQQKPTPPVHPMIIVAFGVMAVSSSAVLIKFVQDGVPSLVIAAWRMVFASLILIPIAWVKKRDEIRGLGKADLKLALLSGVMLALHFATWISSLRYTSVAASTVLVTTSPLWVAIISPFVLKERVSKATKVGIALAMVGSLVVSLADTGGGSQPLWGNFLAVAGAWTVSVYFIIGRKLRATLSILSYITLIYSIAAITLLLIVWVTGQPMWGYAPSQYAMFLLMAILPQLLGHTSFNWALGFLPAVFVIITLVSEPVGSSLLAFLLLGEVPTLLTVVGGVVILAGVVYAARANR